eukprot:TRINITY_DN8045_c0_g1_i1.p1 TRINITY_DN8045_c0_g1~~TRINITY_DN8045_c0_g1_i1.p1  ORF type:complete len:109 (-),score=16.18 TRINITY_DN8045_c0_g1_i1:58-360(-)
MSIKKLFLNSIILCLFVAPLYVLLSWILSNKIIYNLTALPIDPQHFTLVGLHFSFIQMMAVIMTLLFLKFVVLDGLMVWFLGVLMVVLYFILAISFYYHP